MAAMLAGNITVWSVFVDDKKNPVGHYFEVNVESTASVSRLKDAIKAKRANDLAHVDANKLTLWKLKHPKPLKNFRAPVLLVQYVKHVQLLDSESDTIASDDSPAALQLWDDQKVSEFVFPEDELHIILQAPAADPAPGTFCFLGG